MLTADQKMLAAVAFCQDDAVRKMQRLQDRAKWVHKYAPDEQLTGQEHAALLKHDLVKDFETVPPRIKAQSVVNKDKRSRILRKIWTVCCFRASSQQEDLTLAVAAAAGEMRAESERRLREAAAKKLTHQKSLAAAAKTSNQKRKRTDNDVKLLEAMVEAAVSVVEAAAQRTPASPALKRLKALL